MNDSTTSIAGAIGKGLIAGLAGTIAITVSQMIEMKITGRKMSDAPIKVGGDVFGLEPKGKADLAQERVASPSNKNNKELKEELESNKEKLSQAIHFGYGTGWGVTRGALDLMGVRGFTASLAHFGAIWSTALVMLPAKDVAEPVTQWPTKEILIDAMHHAVYALAAGAVYDALSDD